MLLLMAMLGAAVGAPSRWWLDQWVQSRHDSVFPWGTFVINVSGSLLLGVLLAMTAGGALGDPGLALLGVGFCGGFTTFSTFGYETVRLLEDGAGRYAGLNVLGSLAAGLLAAFAGWYLGVALTG